MESVTGLPKTTTFRHVDISRLRGHMSTTCSGFSLIVTTTAESFSITSYDVVNMQPNSRQWDGNRELFVPMDKLPNHTHEVTANR